MVTLSLPQEIGTNSITGIIFDKLLRNIANDRSAIVKALQQQFVIQIGFRDCAGLILIEDEARTFLDFAWREYGVRVDLTFV